MVNMSSGEDHLKRMADLIKSIEGTIKKCSKKYKDRNEIEELYSNLTGFLNKENLNDTKFHDDLNSTEKELKKTNGLSESGRKRFIEMKERIKHLNTELKSMKTMLDKSNSSWIRFNESVEALETWLDEQDRIADKHSIDFSSYQKNQRTHTQLNDSANFLLQISEPLTCTRLRDKLVHLNKRWKMYQDRFKETNNEQLLKYYECEHSLNMVRDRINKIESLVNNKHCKCTQSSIGKYQEELQKACNDIECLDANLKLINKLSARIGGELRQDPRMVRFIEELRQAENRLVQLRRLVPECVKNLTKIHSYVSSIEEGVQIIESWCGDAEGLIRAEPEHLSMEQLGQHLDREKQMESLKKIATHNLDYHELVNKLNRVKDILISSNEKRIKWEKSVEAQQNIWKTFHSKTKLLEDWISSAQQIVSEKNDDLNYLIEKHKDFFGNFNERLLSDFLVIGERLLKIKNENDRLEIKTLMETLEGQWKMIHNHAPTRLAKLEFKRMESDLKRDIKQAENELNEELNALESDADPEEILRRHESIFRNGDFISACEFQLSELKKRTNELTSDKKPNDLNTQEVYSSIESHLVSLRTRVEQVHAQLRVLPQTWQFVESTLRQADSWLGEISLLSMSLFDSNLGSAAEYKRTTENLTPLLDQIEAKKSQLNAAKSQLELVLDHNSTRSSSKLCQFFQEVERRVENLVGNLNKFAARVDLINLTGEISANLDRISNEIRLLSSLSERRFMREEDECSLQMAVDEHKGVLDKIKAFESQVDELREQTRRAGAGSDPLPFFINDKLGNVSEMIRAALSQELDRRSSLLEIKQLEDHRKMRVNSLNRNLEVLHTILTNNLKNGCTSRASIGRSNETSLNEFCLATIDGADETGENSFKNGPQQREVKKYLSRLEKCRELIETSKQILNDLTDDAKMAKPRNADSNDLREAEIKLNQYEFEINQQIDLFETSLAKNEKFNAGLDDLSKRLADLSRKLYGPECEFETVGVLEDKIEDVREELAQIEAIRAEINRVSNEKNFLLDIDAKNLSQSRVQARLLDGFNETVLDLDLKKDRELTARLNKMNQDLIAMKEKCEQRLEGLTKKRQQVCMKEENNMDDLLLESEAVLLDRGLLNETTESQSIKENGLARGEVDIKIEHQRSVDLARPAGAQNQPREEERIEEITVDYVISTNETGEAVIEQETSQVFEKIQTGSNGEIIVNDRSEFRQRHIYDDDIIEMERQKLEEEILKREIEEREKMERFERELALKLENKYAETENQIEMDLLEEQLDTEIKELERLRRIEMEREEKLRLERIEIERIRTERQETSRLERENWFDFEDTFEISRGDREIQQSRIEKEIGELKALDREREEKFRLERIELARLREEQEREEIERLERSRLHEIELENSRMNQIELDRLENEKKEELKIRQEQMETKQRQHHERKLRVEQRLKEICDRLNDLKEKISSIDVSLVDQASTDFRQQSAKIDSFEDELSLLRSEIQTVESCQLDRPTASSPIDSEIFQLVDQAISTQIELIKSFLNYLLGKLVEKRKELRHKETLRSRLAECEANLKSYVDIAKQLVVDRERILVENREDVKSRIDSIESIEGSIYDCLKQIDEIKAHFHMSDMSSRHGRSELQDIMKPLSQYSSNLKTYLSDLDDFGRKLSDFKDFLRIELNWDSLIEQMKSNTLLISSDLAADYEKFTNLRDKLARKMSQSSDLFVLGSTLFERPNDDRPIVSSTAREFVHIRDLLNDLIRFLAETCTMVECARNRLEKMRSLESRTNELLNDIEAVEKIHQDNGSDVVTSNKARLERIVELKKVLRAIVDEKDMLVVGENSGEFDSKLHAITSSTMSESNMRLEGLIKFAKERFVYFENEFHEKLVKQLQSRSALEELNHWIETQHKKLNEIESNLKSIDYSRYLNEASSSMKEIDDALGSELERARHELVDLNEEIKAKKERELTFIIDSIEIEIRQGFYDLKTSETCNRVQFEWSLIKQKLKNMLDRIELLIIKVKKFNTDLNQINDWINLKQCQNELETFTRLKTSSHDQTILLVDSSFDDCGHDQSENILEIIDSYKRDLAGLENDWLRDDQDRSLDVETQSLLAPYISQKCKFVRRRLENLESSHKMKLENNFVELKHAFNTTVNEILAKMSEEMNYIRFGKLTSASEFQSLVDSLERLLDRLDHTRTDIKQVLDKYESQLRLSTNETVIRLDDMGVVDSKRSHAISASLSNRELEASCRALLMKLKSSEIGPVWTRYDSQLHGLNARLDHTLAVIQRDLANVDTIVANEFTGFLSQSNLYQPTVEEMIQNKQAFEEFEATSRELSKLLNECLNPRSECKFEFVEQNKRRVQEKFKDLARLADQLSESLERASQDYKAFNELTNLALELANKSSSLLARICEMDIDHDNQSNVCVLKRTCVELEAAEVELGEIMHKLKQLHLKDSHRIGRVFELSGLVGEKICQLKEKRVHLMGVIHEKSCFVDMKLNEIESSLNRYRSWLKFQPNQRLEKLIADMSSISEREQDLVKHDSELDLLETAYLVDTDRFKIECLRELAQKLIAQLRLISPKDGSRGLLRLLTDLREITAHVKSLDPNSTDSTHLLSTRDRLVTVKHSLEKLITSREFVAMIDLSSVLSEASETEQVMNQLLDRANQLDNLMVSYKFQMGRIDDGLTQLESLLSSQTDDDDLSNLEDRLVKLKSAQQALTSGCLKQEFDRLHEFAKRLDPSRLNSLPYEKYRIRYYDLIVRADKLIKGVEFGLGDLKHITQKSQFLLDLIKQSHGILASVCLKRGVNVDKSEFLNFSTTFEDTSGPSERTLNEWIDLLRNKVMAKLGQHEPLKIEILSLYARFLKTAKFTPKKHELVKSIIDKLLFEWNFVNEACVEKIKKLEKLKSRLNNLDLRLNKIREQVQKIEAYLSAGVVMNDAPINNYAAIMERKSKLESLLECLNEMSSDAEAIFSASLNANRAYFGANSQNETLILGLKERWLTLKTSIKDRLFKLNNIWILVTDLDDQMENFYQVLNKTETFYKNILASTNDQTSQSCVMKQIGELYLIINQDYKLIKYLNESYICLVKLVCSLDSSDCLREIKQKLLDINSRWDSLHNEIALRIRSMRKNEKREFNPSVMEKPTDFHSWASEISLLLTNFEHLSTKELQLKHEQVQALKKEICQQTQFIFEKNETGGSSLFKMSPFLIDLIKSVMKRIIRLDSFLQQSRAPSVTPLG